MTCLGNIDSDSPVENKDALLGKMEIAQVVLCTILYVDNPDVKRFCVMLEVPHFASSRRYAILKVGKSPVIKLLKRSC